MARIAIQIIILIVLFLVLITLFIDEKRLKSAKTPTGKMTGYWKGDERRASVRINAILHTKYSIAKKSRPKKNSISKNISVGGILLRLNEKLSPSTQLALDIILPDGSKTITAEGEVVWVKEVSHMDETGRRIFDTGIRFISMNPKDKERLDKHIKA